MPRTGWQAEHSAFPPSSSGDLSPDSAAAHYVKQCHVLVERQKEAFNEERTLWNLERQNLHDRLAHLETSLRQLQDPLEPRSKVLPRSRRFPGRSSSATTAVAARAAAAFQANIARQSSAPGGEVWRGSKSENSTPTRVFSEAHPALAARLPSIAEGSIGRSQSTRSLSRRISMSAPSVDRSLDGITFRSAPAASDAATGATTMAERRGKGLDIDPHTTNAGHTPMPEPELKRQSVSSSALEVKTVGPEARRPLERHDSYFPQVKSSKQEGDQHEKKKPELTQQEDSDVGLTGTLGLTNNPTEDRSFLNELDLRLNEAVKKIDMCAGSPSGRRRASTSSISEGERRPRASTLDQQILSNVQKTKLEPPLRIKPTTNFGSQWGANPVRRHV